MVSDSKLLLINKLSSPEPFLAEVVSMAHDSDLALLRVKDAEFYTDMTPLVFGGIPKLRSPVQAYGYPSAVRISPERKEWSQESSLALIFILVSTRIFWYRPIQRSILATAEVR